MTDEQSASGTDRAPTVYLPDGTPVKVRLVGAECEGDVSGEGHYGYTPTDLGGEDPTVYFEKSSYDDTDTDHD